MYDRHRFAISMAILLRFVWQTQIFEELVPGARKKCVTKSTMDKGNENIKHQKPFSYQILSPVRKSLSINNVGNFS